jgi:hypothetical protein
MTWIRVQCRSEIPNEEPDAMNALSSTPKPAARSRFLDLGTLPVVCTGLTGIVALYIFLVAFGNLTDPSANEEFIRHVLAMDTTFQDKDIMWRALVQMPWSVPVVLGPADVRRRGAPGGSRPARRPGAAMGTDGAA